MERRQLRGDLAPLGRSVLLATRGPEAPAHAEIRAAQETPLRARSRTGTTLRQSARTPALRRGARRDGLLCPFDYDLFQRN